jgi:hypothetical protein
MGQGLLLLVTVLIRICMTPHNFGNLYPVPHLHEGVKADPHQIQYEILIRIKVIHRIKIRINIMRDRNTVSQYINFSKFSLKKSFKLPQSPYSDPQ